MEYAGVTDRGKVRENNEDFFYMDGRLFIVADGMGGHVAGEVASREAVECFVEAERENRWLDPASRLKRCMLAANLRLINMAREEPSLRGMGTTLTALLLEDAAYICHVGDSRAYLWRAGKIRPITRDHSLVGRMVEEGRLSPAEARAHPRRNVILMALGTADEVAPDIHTINPLMGDRFVLCTDGLSGVLEEWDIQRILESHYKAEEACLALLEEALSQGAPDNVTVLVVNMGRETGRFKADKKRRWSLFHRGKNEA